jgi:hypothetical protein
MIHVEFDSTIKTVYRLRSEISNVGIQNQCDSSASRGIDNWYGVNDCIIYSDSTKVFGVKCSPNTTAIM